MKIASSILFLAVVALVALGMVMLFSASTGEARSSFWKMQPVWCVIGLGACWMLAAVGDYGWLRKLWWLAWLAAIVLLALVLVPGIGKYVKGARRWIELGGFTFQPSEVAKVAVIIALAWYGERFARQMNQWRRGWLYPGLLIAPIMGLIFLEPDWGTAILLAAVAAILLFLAGTRIDLLVLTGTAAGAGLAVLLTHNPVRQARWLAFLDLEKHKEGTGFQVWQSVTAIGSGGWEGKGLCDGRQKFGFVPELHTDFIFSLIGEELGFIGAVLVVVAFAGILCAGLFIARRARDTFGMLLAAGLTFLITLQAAINIGVVTSSLPSKGISLPFISYGGSSLVIMLACVGLLLNVARHANASDNVFRTAMESSAELEPVHG